MVAQLSQAGETIMLISGFSIVATGIVLAIVGVSLLVNMLGEDK